MSSSAGHSRSRVTYYYDADIGDYCYGEGHPMKPNRIRLTHNLVLNYGLYKKMQIYRPHKASVEDMTTFHSSDYIRFLQTIRRDNICDYEAELEKFNVENIENGSDCPAFDGLFEFCQVSAGGSIAGAVKLNKKDADITINWAGGLHHAKRSKASGFCYVNDIVLGILELLKYHQRVLYIDIDFHHGDGVEDAFHSTDRVMTVSFHKYGGGSFPGTGDLRDNGDGKGKYYSVNFPLDHGISDASFESIFVPVLSKVMETYQPGAIVLQCGADSLTEDNLGTFNLSVKGHAKCVEFMKTYQLPLLLLGGGGYTIRNVARCWTYETAVAIGCESDLDNQLPYNDFFEYFGPTFKLHIKPPRMANRNTKEYLGNVKAQIFENLRMLPCAPSVQMTAIPEDGITVDDRAELEKANPDERMSIVASDQRIVLDNEFSDSEDEGEGRKDERSSQPKKRLSQDNSKSQQFWQFSTAATSTTSRTSESTSKGKTYAGNADESSKIEENGRTRSLLADKTSASCSTSAATASTASTVKSPLAPPITPQPMETNGPPASSLRLERKRKGNHSSGHCFCGVAR